MANEQLNPKVLGQLLLMQSVLNNLPDKKSIFSFVCKGLSDIPGIENVIYSEVNTLNDDLQLPLRYPITLGDSFFGELILSISDIDLFKPYENYLKNFIFMIGVILEERSQRQLVEQHKQLLEQRILERTFELNQEKDNLAESQRRFTDLMVNVKLLTVMLDVDGNIIFCNNHLLNLTQYSSEEIMGKNWFDLFLPKQLVEQIKIVFQGTMNGDDFANNYENEILTKLGKTLIISWNNTILYDTKRQIIGTASIGENITERKHAEIELKEKTDEIEAQNEEYLQINEELSQVNEELIESKEKAEESDRLKTAFLQNMSHEIRTPMNAIMGFSELLVKNYNNKPKLEYFSGIINQRCNDLLDIINDILDIAKIESGQLTVNIEECDINNLFTELSSFFKEYQNRINKQQIDFSLQSFFNPLENIIATDTIKLKQILINLITNAFKFTQKGKIEVGCKNGENNHVIFYVTDTGIGIPFDKQNIIFDRFAQLNPLANQAVSGTGIGLAIVKGLVGLLGGKIWLESELEKGTTFYFSLPLVKAKTSIQETITVFEPQEYYFPNKTILVVEDEIYNIAYIKEILSDTGLNILIAETGKEAIQIVGTQTVDLILMDIRLPDMDGYVVLQQIKKLNTNLKIIAQTAYAAQSDKQKALDFGFTDYISKPLNVGLLLSKINKHIL